MFEHNNWMLTNVLFVYIVFLVFFFKEQRTKEEQLRSEAGRPTANPDWKCSLVVEGAC